MKLCADCHLVTVPETDIWGEPTRACGCYGPERELRFDPVCQKFVAA